MKKNLFIIFIFNFFMLSPLWAETKSLCLNLKEMSCALCAAKIESSLKKVDGVSRCSVDHKTNKGSCDYEDSKANPEKIIEACNKSGFKCEKCE